MLQNTAPYMPRFQNTNPERGRKPTIDVMFNTTDGKSDNMLVAIGRKPTIDVMFNTSFSGISEHEPRKGTETSCRKQHILVQHFSISEREPRKGTETMSILRLSRLVPQISEREPRKGTETLLDIAMKKSGRV